MRDTLSFSVLAFAGLGLWAQPKLAAELPNLPSGLVPQLLEEFVEVKPDGIFTYARFRFVAPELSDNASLDYEALADDFLVLCEQYALPKLSDQPEPIDRVIISFSDRAIEFGLSDPDAIQFFEQFTLKSGACIWEQF